MGDTSIEERVSAMEQQLDGVSSELKTVNDRIAKHGMEIDDLRIQSATTNAVLDRIDDTVTTINRKLDEERDKPAERWDTIINQVITVVVAALVGIVLARLGLNI